LTDNAGVALGDRPRLSDDHAPLSFQKRHPLFGLARQVALDFVLLKTDGAKQAASRMPIVEPVPAGKFDGAASALLL
jgi:hypothetical protein